MKEFNLYDYKGDIERLITYIPWFEKKAGEKVSRMYDDNNLSGSSLTFPVYETMLLNFVNDASKSSLMDSNYVYAYSSYRIRTVEDEKKAIEQADLKTCEVLISILSKYVLGGMTKGALWTTAVEEGIFLAILKRFKNLLDIWDKPLA